MTNGRGRTEKHEIPFQWLVDAAMGELSEEKQRILQAHLQEGCPRCEADLAWLQKSVALMRRDGSVEPPAAVSQRAKAIFRQRPVTLQPSIWGKLVEAFRPLPRLAGVVALLVLLISALLYLPYRPAEAAFTVRQIDGHAYVLTENGRQQPLQVGAKLATGQTVIVPQGGRLLVTTAGERQQVLLYSGSVVQLQRAGKTTSAWQLQRGVITLHVAASREMLLSFTARPESVHLQGPASVQVGGRAMLSVTALSGIVEVMSSTGPVRLATGQKVTLPLGTTTITPTATATQVQLAVSPTTVAPSTRPASLPLMPTATSTVGTSHYTATPTTEPPLPTATPTFMLSMPTATPTFILPMATATPTFAPPHHTATPTTEPPLPTAMPTFAPPHHTATPTTEPPLPMATPTTEPPLSTATPTFMPPLPTATPTFMPLMPTATPTSMPPLPTATPTTEPPLPTATPTFMPPTPTATPTFMPPLPTATPTTEPPLPTVTPTSMPPLPTATPTIEPLTPTATPTFMSLHYTATPTAEPPTPTPTFVPPTPTAEPPLPTATPTFMPPTPTPRAEPPIPTATPTPTW